jgi:hypothetical protein
MLRAVCVAGSVPAGNSDVILVENEGCVSQTRMRRRRRSVKKRRSAEEAEVRGDILPFPPVRLACKTAVLYGRIICAGQFDYLSTYSLSLIQSAFTQALPAARLTAMIHPFAPKYISEDYK